MKTLRSFFALSLLIPALAFGQARIPGPGGSPATSGGGQLWTNLLLPTFGAGSGPLTPAGTFARLGIDWTQSGVTGGIPSATWTQSGATITAAACGNGSIDCTFTIQTALNACSGNKFVLMGPGTFEIAGNATVHSNCVLRGSGASQTILNLIGTSGAVVALGSATVFPNAALAVNVSSGAVAGSQSVTLTGAGGISAGMSMAISELNLYPYVSLSGGPGGGNCGPGGGVCVIVPNWGPSNGETRARGQIVQVTGVVGSVVSFTPPLYTDYLHNLPTWSGTTVYPWEAYITASGNVYLQTNNNGSPYTCTSSGSTPAFPGSGSVNDGTCRWTFQNTGTTTEPEIIPFTPSATYAGVENLQFFFNNTHYDTAVGMSECANCWMLGVETNYLDGDIAHDQYGYRNEIRNSYFSNSYGHTPGQHDSAIICEQGSSGELVVSNILERLHVGWIGESGCAGYVVADNFFQSNFDSGSVDAVFGSIDLHTAQPQFGLIEGNALTRVTYDSTWGSNWQGTAFRNWFLGTALICNPTNSTRGTVNCTPQGVPGGAGINGWYAFQSSIAETFDFGSLYFNSLGNVVGSSQMQSLVNTSNNPLAQVPSISWNTSRVYDTASYGYSFGYSGAGDSGLFASDSTAAATASFLHGDYNNISSAIVWQAGITHTLPPSFYLASKPAWWKLLAWPAIGPDVTGGTGPGGHVSSTTAANPPMDCYFNHMGGTIGGAGTPLPFDPSLCY